MCTVNRQSLPLIDKLCVEQVQDLRSPDVMLQIYKWMFVLYQEKRIQQMKSLCNMFTHVPARLFCAHLSLGVFQKVGLVSDHDAEVLFLDLRKLLLDQVVGYDGDLAFGGLEFDVGDLGLGSEVRFWGLWIRI